MEHANPSPSTRTTTLEVGSLMTEQLPPGGGDHLLNTTFYNSTKDYCRSRFWMYALTMVYTILLHKSTHARLANMFLLDTDVCGPTVGVAVADSLPVQNKHTASRSKGEGAIKQRVTGAWVGGSVDM